MKNESTIKVFGFPHIHENTSMQFNDKGLVLASGINIIPKVAQALHINPQFEGKVLKGEKLQVYKHFQLIPSIYVNRSTIITVQRVLLEKSMSDVKIVKKALGINI